MKRTVKAEEEFHKKVIAKPVRDCPYDLPLECMVTNKVIFTCVTFWSLIISTEFATFNTTSNIMKHLYCLFLIFYLNFQTWRKGLFFKRVTIFSSTYSKTELQFQICNHLWSRAELSS